MIYGHFNEKGFLEVEEILDKIEYIQNKNGTVSERIVTIDEQIIQYKQNGWKPVDEQDLSIQECGEFEGIIRIPYDAGDKISFKYEKIFDKWKAEKRIFELKQQLSESDYKIIKCYEANMIGEDLQYDIETLHTERQAIRDEINRIENIISIYNRKTTNKKNDV